MYQHPSTKPIFSNKKEDVDQPNQPNKCHFFQQMHQQKRSALASLASLASRRKDGNHHFDAAKTGSSPGLTRGSNHSGNSVKLRPATLLKWEGKNPWWFPGSLNRRDRWYNNHPIGNIYSKWYISGIYCQLGDYILYHLPPIKGTRNNKKNRDEERGWERWRWLRSVFWVEFWGDFCLGF